jgi:hypothetical protein
MNRALARPAYPQHYQTAYGPRTEHVSLTMLKVAGAMSRGALMGTKDEAPRLHTGGLAPWQAHKVAEFIRASRWLGPRSSSQALGDGDPDPYSSQLICRR